MAALQYKPQPQWKMGKNIEAAAYNGARTVVETTDVPHVLIAFGSPAIESTL